MENLEDNIDEEIEESKKTYKEKEIEKWSQQDVLDWITDLEKEKNITNNEWKIKFEKEKIDGKSLIRLYEKNQFKDIGFVYGEYSKICEALELKKKGKFYYKIRRKERR